jgi:hypothetical protein
MDIQAFWDMSPCKNIHGDISQKACIFINTSAKPPEPYVSHQGFERILWHEQNNRNKPSIIRVIKSRTCVQLVQNTAQLCGLL